jgi:hypothetical protein
VVHLVGDGIAGRLLARSLSGEGLEFTQYGDGDTNTPPVAFVHLFQGRTFHRDPVEITAFRKTIEYWRSEPLASEWLVERSVTPGDRLDRSADTQTVPMEYRPRLTKESTYEYGPGFTIQTSRIADSTKVRLGRVATAELPGTVIHATGLAIENLLPELRWDTNPGRTVRAKAMSQPRRIYLKKGCHLGAEPDGGAMTIGGRVNSKGEAKDDETDLAAEILGTKVEYESEWWGKRIANALDRWPMIGWLNERDFLFAGFGGRALFWLPYCCELALGALRSGCNEEIPARLRAGRFGGEVR